MIQSQISHSELYSYHVFQLLFFRTIPLKGKTLSTLVAKYRPTPAYAVAHLDSLAQKA